MNSSKTKDLTQGSLKKILITLSLPMLIGIMANMSFNLVDTFFIGQLGVAQLTAISFSFPVVFFLLNLSIGLSIGLTSVISRLAGRGETLRMQTVATQATLLTCIFALAIAFLGVNTIEPLFQILGAKKASLPYIQDYMKWAYWAMALRMISVEVSGVFKAHGVTTVPSLAISTTATLNMILDPLLIFGWGPFPAWGIEGAGIATLIANFIALCVEAGLGVFKYQFFTLPAKKLTASFFDLLNSFKIGGPAAFGNALNPVSISIGNYLISLQSTTFVAGFGVAAKIQAFTMIPALALSAALGSTIGQNFGKERNDRVAEAMKIAFSFCLGWGVIQGVGLALFGSQISQLFTENKEAISFSADYLFLVGGTLFGYSFVIITASFLNATDHPIRALMIIALRTLIFFMISYAVLIFFFKSEYAVLYAYAVANAFAGLSAFVLTQKTQKKFHRKSY